MNRAFRIIKLIFLGIALLLCIAIPIVGLTSTTASWNGTCYGFTDGEWPCSWWEFARGEMFWASMIFIPFLFILSLAWIGMAATQFILVQVEKRKK